MRILGIETSCDETAVCLIEATGAFGPNFSFTTLGNALLSQATLHTKYGGVFPNLAKREHAKHLVPLLQKVLEEAGELKTADAVVHHIDNAILEREPEMLAQIVPFLRSYAKPAIDAIAVTHGPGLEPALWVGINFAKVLATAWNMPIVGVDHMEGHIIMPMIENVAQSSGKLRAIAYPVLALLISGGHTELILSDTLGSYTLLGQTRDDAAGEAFDKVARLLGLPYPGGPEISRLSEAARAEGLPSGVSFTRPMLHEPNLDFSFSGLKTAVRTAVEARAPLTDTLTKQIAREFEDTVADVLTAKTMRAVEEHAVQTLIVGGGVSANTHIRQRLADAMSAYDDQAVFLAPPPEWATDNALMIALVGYFHALRGDWTDPLALTAHGNLKLAKTA